MFEHTRACSGFSVDDIAQARQFYFESYEWVDGKGVMPQYGPPIAWFRDPAGNVLAVLREPST